MTPSQLRAFSCVVRLGSVKAAAGELGVSEAAVSMQVAHLRKEFSDELFVRASNGLAFTPGGLRLASRAVEILGLQDRTLLDVSRARAGKRALRIASSSLFAEVAAPGLIELFAARATDLEVELSVHPVNDLAGLLAARAADVAVGPMAGATPGPTAQHPFLNYEVVAVARPEHPLAGIFVSSDQLRRQRWCLGPSVVETEGVVPGIVRRLGIPQRQQRIFQSHAAALEDAKRSDGVALAVRFAVSGDLAQGRLVTVEGPGLRAQGRWVATALPAHAQSAATAELLRFITTPRATQAMVRGAGVDRGRFKPAVHVTLWS